MKTLLVDGSDGDVIALVVRGDHELNAVKAQKLPGVRRPCAWRRPKWCGRRRGCEPGFIGPVDFAVKIYVDRAAAQAADFVCGANERDMHLTGVNWGRDLPEAKSWISATSSPATRAPPARARLRIARGIEVGHIFQLGRKYSTALNATVLDEQGKAVSWPWGAMASV